MEHDGVTALDVRTLLRRSAQFNGDRLAVVASGQRLSFGAMWERAVRCANGLAAEGLAPRDKIAVLEDNGLAAMDFYLAAAAGNFCRVPLYARNRTESHVHMLRNSEARAVVVDESHLPELDGVLSAVPTLEKVIVRDAGYEEWLAAQSADDPDPTIEPDDLFVIRYTGGTTGEPRGVATSHEKWCRGARDWFYLFPPVAPADPVLHVGPISHGSGYTVLPVWVAGGTQVLVAGLTPAQVVDILGRERIAYTFMPPTLLNMLCHVPDVGSRDFSALKTLFVGASPISEDTIASARATFGDHRLWQLYGGTEACPNAGMGPAEWFAEIEGSNPLRAAGRLFPWTELELRDDDGRPVAVGEEGEVWVRSDNSAAQFHRSPEETAERIRDGWVAVGDIGRLDRNGYLYLVDRKNDMIVSGGFNIYPSELENVIADHPDVLEVAVFGVPSDRWGETPMAVCTVVEGATVTESDIQRLVSDRVGSYKKPSHVRFQTDPLPKSAVGKLLRRALREPFWEGRERRVSGS